MELTKIRQDIVTYVDGKIDEAYNADREKLNLYLFSILSHNLYNYYPELSHERHLEIYKTLRRNKALSANKDYYYTFDYPHMMPGIRRENLEELLPAIFVGYHFGINCGYLFPLFRENVNVVIITESEGENLKERIDETASEFDVARVIYPKSTSKVEYLSANSKTLFFDLFRKVKQGYSVFWMIDWAGKYADPSTSVAVNFMGRRLLVTKGLAAFAYSTGRPIVPMVAHYDADMQPDCNLQTPIHPDRSMSLEAFTADVTQKVFDVLERNVRAYPEQWEGWFFLHRLDTEERVPQTFPVPDADQRRYKPTESIEFFQLGDELFLMNLKTGKIIEIDRTAYERMQHNDYRQMSDAEINLLYRNGILVE